MQIVKRTYVELMQALGAAPPIVKLSRGGEGDPFGIARWAASLFAIYDTERMIELDCPWWNIAATREVQAFLASRPDARVFEYGAGASSVWLARRAREVVSVEHHGEWFSTFRRQLVPFPNARLLYRPLESGARNYVGAIEEPGGRYDLIVIDGRQRVACLEAALPYLARDGLVLFDDSGRARYRSAIETCGLAETHHLGRSFCVPYRDHTSILRRNG